MWERIMSERSEKVRENRLRRMAERQGFVLAKSRRRDPRALDYGGWMILLPSGRVVSGNVPHPYSLTINDVEAFLQRER